MSILLVSIFTWPSIAIIFYKYVDAVFIGVGYSMIFSLLVFLPPSGGINRFVHLKWLRLEY